MIEILMIDDVHYVYDVALCIDHNACRSVAPAWERWRGGESNGAACAKGG